MAARPHGPSISPLMRTLKTIDLAALAQRNNVQHQELVSSLFQIAPSCTVNFAYDAIWLAAIAFSRAHDDRVASDTVSSNIESCTISDLQRQQKQPFSDSITNTTLRGATGNVGLLPNGDRDAATVFVSIENIQSEDDGFQVQKIVLCAMLCAAFV